ncbi:small ribosomal subunit protein uS19-like [Ruditapes philippinarum]|uniref:small ribosomal subunit protein uS19-like n=1 Tax=Ruditapes philippinarum TaxID=129788 RepID=UPI00295B7E6A|nr:small ribosomal subunit protein uS19-like [Ruditapes philippinarum]
MFWTDKEAIKKKRPFRKFAYRGFNVDQLQDMTSEELEKIFTCRVRRRLKRRFGKRALVVIKRLRKARAWAWIRHPEKEVVKTHVRNMVIVPEMIGSILGVYNGKTFNQFEIKPEMIGHYLGEFSITYKPVKHGRPGIGATHSSRFIPLK